MGFPQSPPTASPPIAAVIPRKKVGRMILLSGVIWAGVIAAFFLVDCSGKTEGEIRATGEPLGDFVMQPPACHSGEHESFFGVWAAPQLETINGRTGFKGGLKIVKNQTGQWEAYVENPNSCQGFDCKIVQIDPQHCTVFDVEVRNTNTTVNDIRLRRGHANLDCRFPEGGTLKAQLKFSGCN